MMDQSSQSLFFQDDTNSDIYCRGKKVSPKVAGSFEF